MNENLSPELENIITPHGLRLGTRYYRDGKLMLRYKQGKRYDDVTLKELAECITGFRIKEIHIIPAE